MTQTASPNLQPSQTLGLWRVLLCGALVVTLAMGIRHGFGLWQLPLTQANNWSRETFSFAHALQNLSWGFFGIFAGMIADKFGAYRVILVGGVLYALGLYGMGQATTPFALVVSMGLLVGLAQTGTTYAVIYGIIGRNIPADKRSWAMGVAAAAGSFGQFLMLPIENKLIQGFGAQQALLILAAMAVVIVPLALLLKEPGFARGQVAKRDQTILDALKEAFKYPSFQLLMAGYFVCGFQVVFIGFHLPSYLSDKGMAGDVAPYALALVGFFNIFGTYYAGALGAKINKPYILSFIYFARAVAIAAFLFLPISPLTVYVFAAVMGTLWLSTVPPTTATVAQIFGVAHLSMLGGFVFFSHQIGSFIGVWMGGYLRDTTGSYDVVWYLTIALGVFAGLVNLPVSEKPIARKPLLAGA